jgi:methionyl-tRNA synthetase
VRFQIGTDEHGVKIQRAAEKEKLTPAELVDRNVPLYEDLYWRLAISSDDFIRTTDRKRHWPTVIALWKKLSAAGALEKRTYRGLYCQGCERFMAKRDLVDGKCPNHDAVPEEVSEENWFFLLSKESKWLKDLLTREDGYRIVPNSRAQETLSLIDQGLEDVSFSRPKSSLSWGIPVPGEPSQIMYVWCDALTNYISGLGYFTDHEEKEWWEGAEVIHVIGKDIARFHALIWPAMLKHAGLKVPPPQRLLIHGFITNEGQKMSKTIGNVVEPEEVLKKFGGNPDPLRFYLSHEIPVGNDGDFSWKRIEELYDAVLRKKLGNLLNRVLVLLNRAGGSLDAFGWNKENHGSVIDKHWEWYEQCMNDFDFTRALYGSGGKPNIDGRHALNNAGPLHLVELCNGQMQMHQPWEKEREQQISILTGLCEFLRHASLMLLPFIPKTAQEISRQLGVPYAEKMLEKDFQIIPEMKKWGGQKDWKKVGEPRILFPPLS